MRHDQDYHAMKQASEQARALLRAADGRAYDEVVAWFEPARLASVEGLRTADAVLDVFRPGAFLGGRIPQWYEADAPRWLEEEPRWLELCARLRKHPALGFTARQVLRYARSDLTRAALAAVIRSEPKLVASLRREPDGRLLARYQAGEYAAVWREIRAFGGIEGAARAEVVEVAAHTMARAHGALEQLIERLRTRGWPVSERTRARANQEDFDGISTLEQAVGSLPPTLVAFWKTVGGLWLAPSPDAEEAPVAFDTGLDFEQMDPIVVESARWAPSALAEWRDGCSNHDSELWDPFELPIAPDHYHKAGISGGPPYAVVLPFSGADPIVANEEHALPLLDYLRLAVRCGGFTRLSPLVHAPKVAQFLAWATADLPPF